MTSEGPYKTASITRLTGFSAVLLRAWERRYGLLKPQRGPGGHRMYTDDDLKVLERIRDFMQQGRAIGEIAALGRRQLLAESGGNEAASTDHSPGTRLAAARGELVEAALGLDADRINRGMDDIAATFSSAVIVEQIIEPVATEIGDLWAAGRCTVATEHLISSIFEYRILKLIETAESDAVEGPSVLAVCFPGEQHHLGLLVLCYFMNRTGVRVLYLGSNLPMVDLRDACTVAHPNAVLFSVTIKTVFRNHRAALLSLAEATAESVLFYIGGQGVPRSDSGLEARGVRLVPEQGLGREVSLRIAAEIRSNRPPRGTHPKKRS